MLMNETDAILDDILARWHHWQKGKPVNGVDRLDDPTFRDAACRSGWDSAGDVIDRDLESHVMRAVDFHVSGDAKGQGGLPDPGEAEPRPVADRQQDERHDQGCEVLQRTEHPRRERVGGERTGHPEHVEQQPGEDGEDDRRPHEGQRGLSEGHRPVALPLEQAGFTFQLLHLLLNQVQQLSP